MLSITKVDIYRHNCLVNEISCVILIITIYSILLKMQRVLFYAKFYVEVMTPMVQMVFLYLNYPLNAGFSLTESPL